MTARLSLVAALIACGLAAGTQSPVIRIESPSRDDIVRGNITIKVAVPSGETVTSLTISVDGAAVCTITAPPFECRHDAGLEPRQRVIRAVATFSSGARAVDTVATRESTRSVFRTSADAVLINVSVLDRRGRFVAGLKPDQFRVLDNGEPQEVTFFAPEGWGCEVVLAIDMSGSMATKLPEVRRAAQVFLDTLRPSDGVTVAAFNSEMFVLTRPKDTPEARSKAIGRLAPWGGTAIFDTLLASVDLFESHDRRRAIVMFTDGDDRSSSTALERVEQRLAAEDVLLYVVGHGSAAELPEIRATLLRVAEGTGGRALFVTNVGKAPEAFREIVEDLSQRYTLGFTPRSTERAGALRELQVEIPGKSYRIRARRGYLQKRQGT